MVIQKTESKLGSVDVGSVAFMTLAFVFFMMGAAFILTSKLVGVYIDVQSGEAAFPSYSIVAAVVALVVAMVALIILNFGAFFNGQTELNAIIMGFVVTLLVAVVILVAAVATVRAGRHNPEPIIEALFASDFSMPVYIAALFMLVGGILLFFKRGNYKIIGVTYVLGALMYVFFARAIQIISNANGDKWANILVDSQTPLVIAGVFAIVAGILALYIGVSKTNVIRAPLA